MDSIPPLSRGSNEGPLVDRDSGELDHLTPLFGGHLRRLICATQISGAGEHHGAWGPNRAVSHEPDPFGSSQPGDRYVPVHFHCELLRTARGGVARALDPVASAVLPDIQHQMINALLVGLN